MEENGEAVDMGAVDIGTEEDDDISAILAESIESNSKLAELSPEEAAWVDSCFVSDQRSDESWYALKKALLETDDEELSNVGHAHVSEAAQEREEETGEHNQIEEKAEITLVSDREENESLLGPLEEIESRDNIFKVWELETCVGEGEENELVKQLEKALMESEYQGSTQSGIADDEELGVDELVAGIGDLSLEPPPPPPA